MIYDVSGDFGSRRGVDVGSITLHPSGLPHGPVSADSVRRGRIGSSAGGGGSFFAGCDDDSPARLGIAASIRAG
jgi:hypothetical protein